MTSRSDFDVDSQAQGKYTGRTLSLSAPAAAYIRSYLSREGKLESAVRVSAIASHCMGGRGYGYSIVVGKAGPGDDAEVLGGLIVAAEGGSIPLLRGSTIDLEESIQGRGLVVKNPNSFGKCHCGRHDLLKYSPDGAPASCHGLEGGHRCEDSEVAE